MRLSDFWTKAMLTFSFARPVCHGLRFRTIIGSIAIALATFIGDAQPASGIGQPSYYWKDGEWKPYASPAQAGKVATASSTGGLGQPNTAIGQPNTGLGQTTIGIGQPNTGLGQTTIGIGKPTIGIGQPNAGIGQPTIGIGQPTIGIGQPAGGIGQPTIGLGQPNTALGQPTIGIGQPNTGIGQPTIGIGQQMNAFPAPRRGAWPHTNGQSSNWQNVERNRHPASLTRTNRAAGPKQAQVKKPASN
jgi:hypothetical protein